MLYKTRGVVLRDYELADQDKIIELFSQKYGKLKVVAKGARRLKSRFAPTVQPISYVDILAYRSKKGDLDTLSECQLISLFPKIKKDLLRMACANYIAELTAKLTPIQEKNVIIFSLVLQSLSVLGEFPKNKLHILLRAFELKLLRLLGYAPVLEECAKCRKKLKAMDTCYFCVEAGGILCEECARGKKSRVFSKGSIKTMLHLCYSELNDVKQLRLNKRMVEDLEILPFLFIPYHTKRFISGYKLVKEVSDK